MQRNRQAPQDGGFLRGMFPINHLHVSDGERAKSHWGHVSTGLLHGFQLMAGAVLWKACNRDSISLSVSMQLSWAFLGVQVHRVITENLCTPLLLPQAAVQGSVRLCESLQLGLSRTLLGHRFVSRQSQKLRGPGKQFRLAPELTAFTSSQSSPLSSWGPGVRADRGAAASSELLASWVKLKQMGRELSALFIWSWEEFLYQALGWVEVRSTLQIR